MTDQRSRRDKPAEEKTPADLAREFAFTVWSYKKGEMVSLMIHLGDRLGLYRALQGGRPGLGPGARAEDRAQGTLAPGVAARPGCQLSCSTTAAKTASSSTTPRRPVLADEENSIFFAGGAFGEPVRPEVVHGSRRSLRDGNRAVLRPARSDRRTSHRADARTVDAHGPRTPDHSGPRRRRRQAERGGEGGSTSGAAPVWPCSPWRRPIRTRAFTATTRRAMRSSEPRSRLPSAASTTWCSSMRQARIFLVTNRSISSSPSTAFTT